MDGISAGTAIFRAEPSTNGYVEIKDFMLIDLTKKYGSGNEPTFEESNIYTRQFAFVEGEEITGYFSYSLDNLSKSLYNMGLLSFERPNYAFIKEVIKHIEWLFDEKIIDRMDFFAYEDNPAIRGYDKMVEKFGGRRVGKFTKSQRLYDGKLHNTILYEILREDYENAKRGR